MSTSAQQQTDYDGYEAIVESFDGKPCQQTVIELLLDRGFSINDDGRIISDGIEINHSSIAREAGVDRGVVESVVASIDEDEQLSLIFKHMGQMPCMVDLATVFDFTVLTIEVEDPEQAGIIRRVSTEFDRCGVSVRQLVCDDPDFTESPRLDIVTGDRVPGRLFDSLRTLPFVLSIEVS